MNSMQFKYKGNIVKIKVQNSTSHTKQSHSDVLKRIDTIKKLNDFVKLLNTSLKHVRHELISPLRAQIRKERTYVSDWRGAHPETFSIETMRHEKSFKKARKLISLKKRYDARHYTRTDLNRTERFQYSTSPMSNLYRISQAVKIVNDRVRIVRAYFKSDAIRSRRFLVKAANSVVDYELTNGCFKPGQLAEISKRVKSQIVFNPKKPITADRHLSVEIECFGPVSKLDLAQRLVAAGLGRYVELKSDGSIRPNKGDEHAYELAVLAPADQFKDIITKISLILLEAKCKVNKSCGLHVHLDTRGNDAHRMFSNLVSAQTVLYKMQPLSRRSNSFCERTGSKDLSTEIRKGKRYLGINPMSYRRHGTIEVRLHSGTIEARKIVNFVKILEMIAYHSVEIKRAASTVGGFVRQYSIPTYLEQYINERIEKFNSVSTAEQEEAS